MSESSENGVALVQSTVYCRGVGNVDSFELKLDEIKMKESERGLEEFGLERRFKYPWMGEKSISHGLPCMAHASEGMVQKHNG